MDEKTIHLYGGMAWVTTPKTCKECKHYDKKRKCCSLKVCRYRGKR